MEGLFRRICSIDQDAPYEFPNPGESHYLALHDIALRDGELRIDGLKPVSKRNLRDTTTFVPKGCMKEGWRHPEPQTNSSW